MLHRKSLLILCICVFLAFDDATVAQDFQQVQHQPTYTDCGSLATINSLQVQPCDNYHGGCILRRGSDVNFRVSFTPHEQVEQVTHEVYGSIFGIKTKFHGIQNNACPNVNTNCPIQAGTPVTYTNSFQILRSYPRIPVGIEYNIFSVDSATNTKRKLICFTLPSSLQ